MNRTPDVELVLREYLAEDGASAPDHVLDAVQTRIGRLPERRSWPFHRRTPMTRIKLAATLAAALIVAVIAYTQLARQPSVGTQSPAPVVTPVPSKSPTADTSPMPTRPWWLSGATGSCGEAPGTPFGCAGDLAAGTHSSAAFQPRLTYTVPAGWINYLDVEGEFRLLPDTPESRGAIAEGTYVDPPEADLTVVRIDRSIDPIPCMRGPAWKSPTPTIMTTEAIVNWVANHGLSGNRSTVTMNGLTGERIDVQYPPDWSRLCARVEVPGGSSPMRHRVIVLALPGSGWVVVNLRVSPSARGDAVEPFFVSATPIVDSFVFELGPSSS
jgi:hypothetical protein